MEFNDIIKPENRKITLEEMQDFVYQIDKVFKKQLEEKDLEIISLKKTLAHKEKFYLTELDKLQQKYKLELDKLYQEIENIEK